MSTQSKTSLSNSTFLNAHTRSQCLHIGITGHRDIVDEEPLRDAVWKAFTKITAEYNPQQICLHIPLSEGSDRLVFEEFEKWKKSNGHISIAAFVVIPLSPEEYRVSFEKSHREWLDQQLGKFNGITRILRDPYYANPYDRLASHFKTNCDLVIALWDGIENGVPGGTSELINYLVDIKTFGRCKTVLWIASARKSNPYPTRDQFSINILESKINYRDSLPKVSRRKKFRKFTKLTLIVVALLTVIGGSIGYVTDEKSPLEAPAIAITHLAMGSFSFSPEGEPPYNVWILISWFSGVLFALLSAGAILNSVYDIWRKLRQNLISREPHDIIFGLGDRGQNLIESGYFLRKRMIAVDPSPSEKAKELCEKTRVPLVAGDGSAGDVIDELGLKNVERAFVCTDNDISNIRICYQLHEKSAQRAIKKPLICAVGLHAPENADTLHDSVALLAGKQKVERRVFNQEAVTIRSVFRQAAIERFSASPQSEGAFVIIIGTSAMAEALLEQVLKNSYFEGGKKIRIVRICDDSRSACEKFVEQHFCYNISSGEIGSIFASPETVWLDSETLPAIEFIELPKAENQRVRLVEEFVAQGDWVVTVFICDSNPLISARLAKEISPSLERFRNNNFRDITLWFYFHGIHDFWHRDLGKKLDQDSSTLPIRSFTDFMGDCDYDCALESDLYRSSKGVLGYYAGLKRGDDGGRDEAWTRIDAQDQEASKNIAEHALIKLNTRDRLRRIYETDESAVIAELVRIEHRRWCGELLLKGFRPLTRIPSEISDWNGPLPSETELIERWFCDRSFKRECKNSKRHVDLVPFDDLVRLLGEDHGSREQLKDHNLVEGLDQFLGLDFNPEDDGDSV